MVTDSILVASWEDYCVFAMVNLQYYTESALSLLIMEFNISKLKSNMIFCGRTDSNTKINQIDCNYLQVLKDNHNP